MSLSTHVLDTVRGSPAEGMKIELWQIGSDYNRKRIGEFTTNSDGRVDSPLLTKEESNIGVYELVFYIADYFRGNGDMLPEPAFLDEIPIRFGIADPNSHYHVPLLVSPWSYSTYRGS